MTRPSDESFEAFVDFRENTMIKRKNSKLVLLKDDLITEWERFWEYVYSKPNRKYCIGNQTN